MKDTKQDIGREKDRERKKEKDRWLMVTIGYW
jgi:hypothetical protein